MKRSKDISLVIPARNRASLIGRTLASVAAQTMAPAEIFLVDNGSDDDTLEVMRSWAEGRAGVSVISESRPGACAARNAGLKLVKTRFVMFFDSDDVMLPQHIADFQAAIDARPEAAILGRDIVNEDAAGRRRTYYFTDRNPIFSHIFRSCLSTQRIVASTELVRAVGAWDESLKGWNDLEIGFRLLLAKPKVVSVKGSPSVLTYAHDDSITGLRHRDHPERWEPALSKMRSDIENNSRLAEGERRRILRWIDARHAILAAQYAREGATELARQSLQQATAHGARRRIRLIYHHNRIFGRLSWLVAAPLLAF